MIEYEIVAYAAGIILAYLFICNRLISLVQPLRIEMAYLGEELLQESLSARDKLQVRSLLENAHNRWLAWALAFAITPAVIAVTISRLHERKPEKVLTALKRDFFRFYRLGIVSILASNPLAGALFFIQFTILLFLLLPVGRSAKRALNFASGILYQAEKIEKKIHVH